jgi:hypothetical protein
LIGKLALFVAAIALMAAAVAVAVVAAAFAIYAALQPQLGPAGAAAVLAAGCAVLVALGALALWLKVKPKRSHAGRGGSGDAMTRLMQLARERPIIAAGALIAGSMLALRNPAITALVVKSFFDSRKPEKR